MVGVFALDGSGVVAELPAVGRPAWSPDGARLAVLDQRTGDVQIFELATGMSSTVAHADLATRLTESPGSQGDVVGWSPDGTRLAYSFIPPASQMSGLYETHVVNADGSGNVTVAADIAGSLKSGRAPVWWGRDGRLVRVTGPPLASADPGQFSVQEIDPSTGKVGNTVATFALPHSFVLDNAVSAPLNAAAFITVDINNDHAYTVSVIDLTTGRADAVTVASATDQVEFSPDGSSLAFVTTDEVGLGDELHLYVLNGGVDRIVTTKADGRRPTWSPTGDVIAVDGVPVKLVDVSSGEVSTLDVVPFECYDLFLAWRP